MSKRADFWTYVCFGISVAFLPTTVQLIGKSDWGWPLTSLLIVLGCGPCLIAIALAYRRLS